MSRTAPLLASSRIPDRHEWLGLPDGGVAAVPIDDVVSAVARTLDEEDPAVLTADGYGLVGGIGQYENAWLMAYVRGPEGIIVL